MHVDDGATREGFVARETSGVDFRDRRLDERLRKILFSAIAAPGSSFPEICEGDAALEATYRFLNNERVSAAAILAPHVRATAKRVRAAGRVVVAHDSTEFSFGPIPRGDLEFVGRGTTYGFSAHVAFAVSRDEERVPLGV